MATRSNKVSSYTNPAFEDDRFLNSGEDCVASVKTLAQGNGQASFSVGPIPDEMEEYQGVSPMLTLVLCGLLCLRILVGVWNILYLFHVEETRSSSGLCFRLKPASTLRMGRHDVLVAKRLISTWCLHQATMTLADRISVSCKWSWVQQG